jgi:lipopolysaccharide/colanic/teichoic acid biosynthesis glycosyltransferase
MDTVMEFWKRVIDLGVSAFILLLSLPLWPVIALAIKANSRGPIFYTQKRMGKDERIFLLIKFRSMIDKAEKLGPKWAEENDNRITSVGKFLRRLHLDELPQLLNVIKGEMSLVGPRPERPQFVAELKRAIPDFGLRHRIKPGITGWAQVNYPYAASLEDSRRKYEYDLYYLENRNLLLDISILWKTIGELIKGERKAG